MTTSSFAFRRSFGSLFLVAAALVATIAACGGGAATPAASPAPAASGAAAGGETGAPLAWSDSLSHSQKADIMKHRVMPDMKAVFADEKDFSCKGCHGSPFNPKPQEVLPKLVMKGGKMLAFEEKPEEAKFMAEKVVPAMAKALNVAAYDPATHQGFGCSGCHGIENK